MSIFDKVAVKSPQKSVFNLTHSNAFTCRPGQLIPNIVEPVVPGDVFSFNDEIMVRTMPLATALMSQWDVYHHVWFVPTRLIWDDFYKWISPDESEYDTPTITHPYRTITNAMSSSIRGEGSLFEHMGIYGTENVDATGFKINVLPARAYNRIYNDWYRDQDIDTEFVEDHGSGLDTSSLYCFYVRERRLRRDYFTSARPTTQKGGDVELPITGTAPVELVSSLTSEQQNIVDNAGAAVSTQTPRAYNDTSDSFLAKSANSDKLFLDPNGTMEADLSSASSTTVEELRRAMVLQRYLERNARGGTRYPEFVMMQFGETSDDLRIDRPKFIHGSVNPLQISEVVQQSQTDTTPQGTLAGKAISYGSGSQSRYKFKEHGWIISMVSIIPKHPEYYEGMRKFFRYDDRFDYLTPMFARLGEQPIYDFELYNDVTEANMDNVFGYQERYCEWKYIPSRISGGLAHGEINWTTARTFGSAPSLNSDFIKCAKDEAGYHQAFADTSTSNDKFIVNCLNKIKALRPLPYYSTPL